jgi:hypothetical protein
MTELLVDFITSLDGYGAGDGWPGWWGLQGPEYLASLEADPSAGHLVLMGANTYRLMSGFSADGEPGTDGLAVCRRSCSRTPSLSRCRGPTRGWCPATQSTLCGR